MRLIDEAVTALLGSVLLAMGRGERALDFFNLSAAGAKRSFLVAAFTLPLSAFSALLLVLHELPPLDLLQRYLLGSVMGAAFSWLSFLVLVEHLTRIWRRRGLFAEFVTVFNWSTALMALMPFLALGLFQTRLLPDQAAIFVIFIVEVWVLLFTWGIARIALGVSLAAGHLVVFTLIATEMVAFLIFRADYVGLIDPSFSWGAGNATPIR